eukprot:scaffold40666_cov40-Phaeocystis_antarctica.AAC.1
MAQKTGAVVMNDTTAAVLFLSTLGVLYQRPHLRTTAGRLLKWVVGILFTFTLMFKSCESLAKIKSLQTVSPLSVAASAGDRVHTAELLEYKHVQDDINVGKRSGLGLLASTTPLFEAVDGGPYSYTETVYGRRDDINPHGHISGRPYIWASIYLGESRPQIYGRMVGGVRPWPYRHTETVAALLKAGGRPERPWSHAWPRPALLYYARPLAVAAGNDHTEIVAALLKAGADPNARTTLGFGLLRSETPLAEATRNGHTETVAALLKAGPNPNTPMTCGFGLLVSDTPLFRALMNGLTETVAALRCSRRGPTRTPLVSRLASACSSLLRHCL